MPVDHNPLPCFRPTSLGRVGWFCRTLLLSGCGVLVYLASVNAARSAEVTSREPRTPGSSTVTSTNQVSPAAQRNPLLDYAFTNELGQAVTLGSFEHQALAITFFFTRCPIPNFCPRLSKNFAEASQQLKALPNAPTNWHFLSISIDPEFDTPQVLRAYGLTYQYDPAHWSFITGPKDKIVELARLSNVEFEPDSGLIKHNFRTLIITPSGKLQMVFPMGGDLSAAIVSEILKATGVVTNKAS